jgi:hypothetical protein
MVVRVMRLHLLRFIDWLLCRLVYNQRKEKA